MKLPYALHRLALHDLRDIALYTRREWGKNQESLYMGGLFEFFEKIAVRDTPVPPRDLSDIKPGCFLSQIAHHLVIFRWLPDGRLEILRILHERMNVNAHVIEIPPSKDRKK